MITHRTWGYYMVLNEGSNYKIKKLVIRSHEKISYQLHNNRDEYWTLLSNNCDIIIDGKKKSMTMYSSEYIPAKTKHQIINNNDYDIEILELQTGLCHEDDIVRFADHVD